MAYRSKYHNRKVTMGDKVFDSMKECSRYVELSLLQKAGKIKGLKTQVPFELIPAQRDKETGKLLERACSYIADFVYYENGKKVVEDTKGVRTPEYIVKRKLMLQKYGIRIREV